MIKYLASVTDGMPKYELVIDKLMYLIDLYI